MEPMGERIRAALAGRYEIERELGQGGMATVYLARDVRHERQVALKVMRPDYAASLGAERFLREIRVAAALQHPHILPLYDSGEAAGQLYYVMPAVHGESLRERLTREGPLAVDEALRIAREVSEALQHAHDQDLVHRDIKPENILMAGGHPLLVDFGIARAVDVAGGLTLTEAGLAVGTPAYMSPEQASADPRVDGRTDIYALGCVLYEMLAGEPPFTGPTAQAILARHSTEPVPPLRLFRANISPAIESVIGRALSKVPADRFATAAEFARVLRGDELERVSVASRPPRARRLRLAVVPVAVVVMAFGAYLVGSADPPRPALIAVAVSPMPNQRNDSLGYFADGLMREFTTALTRVNGIAPRPSETVAREFAVDSEPLSLGRRLKVDYVVTPSMRWAGPQFRITVELIRVADGTLAWSRQFDGTLVDVFPMQDSIARQIAGELAGRVSARAVAPPASRGKRDPEAYALYLRGLSVGRAPWKPEASQEAARLFHQAIARDSTLADAWVALAAAYDNLSQMSGQAPVDLSLRYQEAIERALSLDSLNGHAYMWRAQLRQVLRWDVDGADSDMRRALMLNPGSAMIHMLYGQLLNQVGRHDSALAENTRALELDPTNAFFVTNQADKFFHLRMPAEAEAEARRALRMDSEQWVAHTVLFDLARLTQRFDDGVRETERAHQIMGDVPWVLGWLGYSYGLAGRRADATRVLSTMDAIRKREYVQPLWLALIWLGLDDRAKVMDELEASERAHDRDFFTMLGTGYFEALRGDARYEAILRRTGLHRHMRRAG